jgi:CBS domain-containing protein
MKAEGIGAVPVCESRLSNRVVGIVTDRDLALEVVAEGREPSGPSSIFRLMLRPTSCLGKSDNSPQIRY